MENTKATLLVGEDATQFALQMGFREQDLHTNESVKMWKEWKKNKCQPNFWNENVRPDPRSSCGPYKPIKGRRNLQDTTKQTLLDDVDVDNHDTIGMIAIDQNGNIAAGTSTNGLNHKISGRVGDSPIPGAGAYVDKDVGGASGTGDGDVMLKFLPSFHAVELLRQGYSPTRAARMALKRIAQYYPTFRGGLITVTKDGRHGAACHGWPYFPYTVRNPRTGKNKIVYIKPCKLIN
ncbi:N(4)-(Beta-N-acetylglucosaminyl)-L-asparaginase-like [Orbicella faveolata]|uniref:N(4)-(Beta-N-acetylglucosaminyl)-L-asparaginase- like n=1 Tax=Orbicella faveolata TaxID=48498 RepID=UPI0009E6246A|nr:N(4)-(Beta-N-acetylglucosaminyl)-L-asparaginase-like [Orbicella faveolata]